jgi:hypothetical protein
LQLQLLFFVFLLHQLHRDLGVGFFVVCGQLQKAFAVDSDNFGYYFVSIFDPEKFLIKIVDPEAVLLYAFEDF